MEYILEKCWQSPKGGFEKETVIKTKKKTNSSPRKSRREKSLVCWDREGEKLEEKEKERKERVKSGEDQITLAQLCKCLVEGCRPARQLGGRIQCINGSHGWLDKSKHTNCR